MRVCQYSTPLAVLFWGALKQNPPLTCLPCVSIPLGPLQKGGARFSPQVRRAVPPYDALPPQHPPPLQAPLAVDTTRRAAVVFPHPPPPLWAWALLPGVAAVPGPLPQSGYPHLWNGPLHRQTGPPTPPAWGTRWSRQGHPPEQHPAGNCAAGRAAPLDVVATLFAVLPARHRPWVAVAGWGPPEGAPPPASPAPQDAVRKTAGVQAVASCAWCGRWWVVGRTPRSVQAVATSWRGAMGGVAAAVAAVVVHGHQVGPRHEPLASSACPAAGQTGRSRSHGGGPRVPVAVVGGRNWREGSHHSVERTVAVASRVAVWQTPYPTSATRAVVVVGKCIIHIDSNATCYYQDAVCIS